MNPTILFICPHGVAKSIMATAYTLQLARLAGLELHVSHAGTEPDEAIPQRVIDLLAQDGLDVSGWHPKLVSREDLERADRVISLGCDLQEFDIPLNKYESWADVPSPSEDLTACRNAIVARVKHLISQYTPYSVQINPAGTLSEAMKNPPEQHLAQARFARD